MAKLFDMKFYKRQEPIVPEDPDVSIYTLKGIAGLRVVVEEKAIRPEVQAEGLTIECLKESLEAVLTGAGIRVFTDEEYNKDIRKPTLYVAPDVFKCPLDPAGQDIVYSYKVTLGVMQECKLCGDPEGFSFSLLTWNRTIFGFTRELGTIPLSIEKVFGMFLDAFFKANSPGTETAAP
jgi:hypothetical protein